MNPAEHPDHDARHIDYPSAYPAGTVVLVSGGVDSLINADAHPEAKLLFVDFGQSDRTGEMQACRSLFAEAGRPVLRATVGMPPDVPTGDGVFVPARNIMLCSLAVHVGDDIVIGAMADDHSVDKTDQALQAMAALLSAQSGRTIDVRAPLSGICKADAMAHYVAARPGNKGRMMRTWSCYAHGRSDQDRCLDCKSCFRWLIGARFAGLNVPMPTPRITERFLAMLPDLSEREQQVICAVLGI